MFGRKRKPRHCPESYICEECAEFMGWKYPAGGIDEWHDGVCDVCGHAAALTWEGDWIKRKAH